MSKFTKPVIYILIFAVPAAFICALVFYNLALQKELFRQIAANQRLIQVLDFVSRVIFIKEPH